MLPTAAGAISAFSGESLGELRNQAFSQPDTYVISAFSGESLGELPHMFFHFSRSFLLGNGRFCRYSAFSKAFFGVETLFFRLLRSKARKSIFVEKAGGFAKICLLGFY